MAIKPISEWDDEKRRIDLTGSEGNAYVLMGYARTLSKELDLDVDSILQDMMSSDYDHLLQVFDKHFGEYVDLYR